MNVGQLRRVLGDAERLYRDCGDTRRANLLARFSNLLDQDQALPVARFAQRISDAWHGSTRKQPRVSTRRRRERVELAK